MLYLLLVFALFSISASAQGKVGDVVDVDIIDGPDHVYALSAPNDWVTDPQSGRSAGIPRVYYPKGSSWAKSAAVMYTNVLKKAGPAQTLSEVIDGELAEFRKEAPNLKVEDAKPIRLEINKSAKDKSAAVKYLTGDASGNFEAIAYIYEEKVVVIVVLTARTKKAFDSRLTAFEQLVRSYSF